jgi:hypothetical protein
MDLTFTESETTFREDLCASWLRDDPAGDASVSE